MSPSLPANVDYGLVTGRFTLITGDSPDGDRYPDGVPAVGRVVFTAKPRYLLDPTADPPATLIPRPFVITLDDEGDVVDAQGEKGVYLVATTDADLNPLDWTWGAQFFLFEDDPDMVNLIRDVSFELPVDSTVDLTTVIAIDPTTGTPIAQGPRGPVGPVGPAGPVWTPVPFAARSGQAVIGVLPDVLAFGPVPVGIDTLTVNVDDLPAGGSDRARLQGSIDKVDAAGGGQVFWTRPLAIGAGAGVVCPQGVALYALGMRRAPITYTGAGIAVDLVGGSGGAPASSADLRTGGDPHSFAVKISDPAATGVRCHAARTLRANIKVLGDAVTRSAVGVLVDAISTIGSSFNEIHVYVENCATAIVLDGTGWTGGAGGWATRNRISGNVQSCATGVSLIAASTNSLHVDVQDCDVAWRLATASARNLIRGVIESTGTITDVIVSADSDGNTFEVNIDTTKPGTALGAAMNDYNSTVPTWRRMRTIRSPLSYDGNGAQFVAQPRQGSTDNYAHYTRNNVGGALVRAWYSENNVALPRVVFEVPIRLPFAALPAATAALRGTVQYVQGDGVTTADIAYICLRSAAGAYSWKPWATG